MGAQKLITQKKARRWVADLSGDEKMVLKVLEDFVESIKTDIFPQ